MVSLHSAVNAAHTKAHFSRDGPRNFQD